MNPLLEFLKSSGYRYDQSAFTPMCRAFLNASPEQREQFIGQARSMPYKNFLRTVYWGIVSGWVVGHSPACRRCKGRVALNVHHQNYEIRGEEHRNLECLEVLCRDCHAENHNLSTEEKLIENRLRRQRLSLPGSAISEEQHRKLAREQIASTAKLNDLRGWK